MSVPVIWVTLFCLTAVVNVVLVLSFLRYRRQCKLAEARHVEVERELQKTSRDLKIIFDSSPAYIWFKDNTNRMLRVNEPAARSIGLDVASVEGKWTEEFYPEHAASYLQDDLEVINRGQPKFNIVERYQDVNGKARWVRTDKVPYRDDEGNVIGVVVFSLDVTEQKRAEVANEELAAQERRARLASEHLGRIKDEFLITLSHELRTPLVPILGWIDLIKSDYQISSEVADALDVIERNARAELSLVEDILDASRVASGKMPIQATKVELRSIIEESLQAVEVAAKAKQIALTASMPTVAIVNGDAKRLRQILWNLLSNAIKFTPEGGTIDVNMEVIDQHVIVSVVDSGIGISRDFLPHVFEAFRQEEAHFNRRFGGLGLGLSLCKYLVEAHGGSISVESEGVNKGTRFAFTLPSVDGETVVTKHKVDDGHKGEGRLKGMRVLLIDDRADELAVTCALLRRERAEVVTAQSAEEGLSALSKFQPNIVVCDVGMPEKDGFFFLDMLKSREGSLRAIPVIAMTAYGGEGMQAKCLAAGFSGFLTKPANACDLVDTIRANLESNARS